MNWKDELQPVLDRLQSWYEAALQNLPNAVVALLVVIVFGILARVVAKGTGRAVERVADSKAITGLITAIVRVAVVTVGVLLALSVLDLQDAIMSLLAGAGVIGLALAFAFQDLAANLIAGVYLGFRRPFVIGDLVETNDYFGFVERIDLRNTILELFDGRRVIIPNKTVFENPLTNHTATPERRVEIPVGVAYETDLEEATAVVESALGELPFVLGSKPVQMLATGFGGSSIDFEARFWIDNDGDVDWLQARHRGLIAVNRALKDAGIEIPFPIRTLDLGRARDVLVDDWTSAMGEQLADRGAAVGAGSNGQGASGREGDGEASGANGAAG